MKYLVILFSLYMTFLTVAPCQDGEDAISATTNQSSFSTHIDTNGHSKEESCPPFCTCACCSVSRNIIHTVAPNIVLGSITVPYCEYKMPAIAEQVIEIYQPPQIV